MSEADYLVGVEEYELAFVEDVLDDSPVDAQTVYKETIEMSPRSIAAEAAYRTTIAGPGGAPSGPAGGVLGGTYPDPSFAADMATQAELDAHVNDATAAHAATAIAFTPDGSISATTVQAAIVEVRDEAAGGGAPSTVDYLVGTASGGLSAEIVVGTTPGGELGGTWGSPTVDATHSGSSHADVQAAAEATAAAALSAHVTDTSAAHAASAISADSTTLVGTGTDVQAVLEELDNSIADHIADSSAAHAASAISVADSGDDFTATDVEGVLAELQADHEADATALSDHISDSSAAHAASAISADSTTLVGTGTTVQAVFEELDNAIVAAETATSNHLSDSSAAHAASAISADSTTLVGTGTDVQAVLEELDNGIADHLADSSAAHAASAISFSATGGVAATDVQAAIAEVDSEKTTAAAALSAAQTEIADQKREIMVLVTDPNGAALTTGDGKAYVRIPALLNGHNLVAVAASVSTTSSSGIPTVQLRNATQTADMLTTKLTIDEGELDSKDATAAAVIDTGNDDVATGDQIYIDVDVAGTGTKGLIVSMTFEAP